MQVKLLEAESLRDLARALVANGSADGARKSLARALALFEELGAERDVADTHARMARLGSEGPRGRGSEEGSEPPPV
jgi:hypothetical protein